MEDRVDEDVKWMLLPNGRGDPQLAIISGLERNSNEVAHAEQMISEIERIKFYLYTRYESILIQTFFTAGVMPVLVYFAACSAGIAPEATTCAMPAVCKKIIIYVLFSDR